MSETIDCDEATVTTHGTIDSKRGGKPVTLAYEASWSCRRYYDRENTILVELEHVLHDDREFGTLRAEELQAVQDRDWASAVDLFQRRLLFSRWPT